MIAAIGENNEMGYEGGLPWKIKEDLAYFKKVTQGAAVIMGSHTWKSIGSKPLPGRVNVVVTSFAKKQQPKKLTLDALSSKHPEAFFAHDIPSAVLKAQLAGAQKVFFIGGARVYKEVLPLVERFYLTIVQGSHKADVFFPEFDFDAFVRESEDTYFTKEHIVTNFVLRKKEIHGKRTSRAGDSVVRNEASGSTETGKASKIHWKGASHLPNGTPRGY